MGKLLLRKITNNLGKLQIEEDKIICYVNNQKLYNRLRDSKRDNFYKTNYKYRFYSEVKLEGMDESQKLFKPIYYIIDSIVLLNKLKLKAHPNVHIIFKNCYFAAPVYIEYAKNIVFEKNRYSHNSPNASYDKVFLSGRAENLKFVNDNFYNLGKYAHLRINLDVDNLEIKESNINLTKLDGDIIINAKSIELHNSNIYGNDIKIKTDKLILNNSEIKSCTKIILDNESSKNNNNIFHQIKSPTIIYNGIDLSRNDELSSKLEKEELRNTLIGQLKILRDDALKINQDRLNKFKNKIDSESIVKVIKNK